MTITPTRQHPRHIGSSRALPESRVVTLRYRLAVVQCLRLPLLASLGAGVGNRLVIAAQVKWQLDGGKVVDGTAFYDSISFNDLWVRVQPR